MSRIDELIQQLCPDGVEYKPLGEIAEFTYGYTAKAQDKGDARFIRITDIGKNGFLNHENAKYITLSNESNQYLLEKGDLLVARTGATYGKTLIITSSEKSVYASFLIKITLNPNLIIHKFYWHFSRSKSYWEQTFRLVSSSSQPQFNTGALKKLSIPLPPLPVQEEIVRILDKFTALEAELEAELEARRKQYEYYRDQLLTFGDEVEWKPLGEICDYVDYRGKTPKKTEKGIFLVTAKNIRPGFIDYSTSKEYISEEDYATVMHRGKPEIGDVLITTEAPCGFVAQVDRSNIALAQRVIKYRSRNPELSNSFLKFFLLGKCFQEKLDRAATGSTVKGIKGSKLHKLTVPLPPRAEQERIVRILDKFDALVNDISSGLPAELEMRRKQYEYYRDKLLTFKPIAKEA